MPVLVGGQTGEPLPSAVAAEARLVAIVAIMESCVRVSVAENLRADRFEVLEAGGGIELLRCLHVLTGKHDRAALVIADFSLSTVSGLDVLIWLRRANDHTPIILITNHAAEDRRSAAERLGARIFDAPFDVDDLRTVALHLVRRPGARRSEP